MNINFSAPLNSLGYGVAGLNFLRSLSLSNNVVCFPIGQIEVTDERYQECVQIALDNQAFYDYDAPSVRLFHQFSLAENVGRGRHIGFPIFELDQFTERELHHLRGQDQLLVCSHWAQKVCADFDLKSDIVPLGVDTDIFYPNSSPERKPGPTVFINFGKIEVRKGHDVICQAFNDAFEPADNVLLVMIFANPFLTIDQSLEWVNMYEKSKMGHKVHICKRGILRNPTDSFQTYVPARLPTQIDIAEAMRNSDCGLFPTRAEGWNLELLEMMACGKHFITTDYGGQTEYSTEENSLLVKTSEMESAYDGQFFFNQGHWASLGVDQVDQMVQHMRSIHRRVQDDSLGNNLAGIITAQKFSWSAAADKLVRVISD